MTVVPGIDQPFTVRGAEIRPDDTPEQYSQKLARIAIDEVSPMVAVLSTQGIVLVCNRTALAAAEVELAEALGKPLWESIWRLAAPKAREDLNAAITRAAQGHLVRCDVEIAGANNGRPAIVMDLKLRPVMEGGRVALLVAEWCEVTQQRDHDQELNRFREASVTAAPADAQHETEEELRQAHAELQLRTAELARFNHVAVGREMRLIELKNEVNQLREQLGEPARYGLDFEHDSHLGEGQRCETQSQPAAPLESILLTKQLQERPARAPDYEAENRALTAWSRRWPIRPAPSCRYWPTRSSKF
jgi:hypothetical protein